MHLSLQFLVVMLAGFIQREQQDIINYLIEENRVLREKLGNRRIFFSDVQRRRLARRAKQLGRAALHNIPTIVTPDTLLRWYRQLVAQKYDGSHRHKPGRPKIHVDIEQLIVDMATKNPRWGYTRIRGALDELGHHIARSTIARVLHENGIGPSPERTITWNTFLKSHWGAIAATDFFSVEVVTKAGLVRYLVLFVIDLKSRRVQIANISNQTCGNVLEQVARNWTDAYEGFLKNHRYLIHDRDPLFTNRFTEILRDSGVQTLKLPARSPNLNAFAERFVGSIRRECLDHVIPLGEQHLRTIIREYVEHYNAERHHQGLGNHLLTAETPVANDNASIQCRSRLGGLLNFYHRGAA